MNEYVPTDKGVFVLFLLTFWFCFGFVVLVWDGVFLHLCCCHCLCSVSVSLCCWSILRSSYFSFPSV